MGSAQAQTRGSEVKHIRLLDHARQQKTAQNFVQAIESKSKQYLQHLIARQPSKPRVSPAIRGVINNLEVGQRDGVLLQSLQLSFFQCHIFFYLFLFGGRDIHYTNATITTSKKCDVHCKP